MLRQVPGRAPPEDSMNIHVYAGVVGMKSWESEGYIGRLST